MGYWRLLGTRARTALLCDSIEAQVWFFTNIVDRSRFICTRILSEWGLKVTDARAVPWVKYVVLIFVSEDYLDETCAARRKLRQHTARLVSPNAGQGLEIVQQM